MQVLTDIARLLGSGQADVALAIIGALVLATLDGVRQLSRARAYDAWWYFHARA
ncbi:hypothetical protein [Phenylobacterium sp.]|uniref:hypothetical protein n=1 Tax=Phenylobacterium sp. TaxID=1871053 RepID=UPI00261D7D9D|nr:hypothetical protein [Phenylobacterium sp.]